MRLLIEEYFRSLLTIVYSVAILTFVMVILISSMYPLSIEAIKVNVNEYKTDNNKMKISIGNFTVKDATINKGDQLEIMDNVVATNSKGEDISNYVSLLSEINTSIVGKKEANYVLRYNGETKLGKAFVFVEENIDLEI